MQRFALTLDSLVHPAALHTLSPALADLNKANERPSHVCLRINCM